MRRLIRIIFGLLIVLTVALIGYAYIADLNPPEGTTTVPISISKE